jgi:hypothetical protein
VHQAVLVFFAVVIGQIAPLAVDMAREELPGACPAFSSAAKAPDVATIWPSAKALCLLVCRIEKTPFVRFVFCFSEAPQKAAH